MVLTIRLRLFITTPGPTNVQRMIKKYYEQSDDYKLDDFDEINQFLEQCKLPKLAPGKIKILNRLTL